MKERNLNLNQCCFCKQVAVRHELQPHCHRKRACGYKTTTTHIHLIAKGIHMNIQYVCTHISDGFIEQQKHFSNQKEQKRKEAQRTF